jgi:hypothetical protein
MNIGIRLLVGLLTLTAVIIFLASCVIALSDGQGAIVFILSIPVMSGLLFLAGLLCRKITVKQNSFFRLEYIPKCFFGFLVLFFVFLFIPGLQKLPVSFLECVGKTFAQATGKTPYAFFKDRASFANKLSKAIKRSNGINFSDFDVTFAWDKVCILSPYTNNEKANQVLKMEFNIEERSQIHQSDSINALVFLFQGDVNQVVDLKRSIADFKVLDVCYARESARFIAEVDANGLSQLKPVH